MPKKAYWLVASGLCKLMEEVAPEASMANSSKAPSWFSSSVTVQIVWHCTEEE